MSRSASFGHQRVITEIAVQIGMFLRSRPLGQVAVKIDVRLSDTLVYRPDVTYLDAAKAARCETHVSEIPDVIVEVISPDSTRLDRETKKRDYERFGVGEYWLIDPLQKSWTFYRLTAGRYAEVAPTQDGFRSQSLAGFELDLRSVRAVME